MAGCKDSSLLAWGLYLIQKEKQKAARKAKRAKAKAAKKNPMSARRRGWKLNSNARNQSSN